jgi:hypothetical protein
MAKHGMIDLTFRDHFGRELDRAEASDGFSAVSHAMRILSRRERLDPGDVLMVGNNADEEQSGPTMQIRVGNLRSICERLEARAAAIENAEPEWAADLRTAARFCRHAIKVCWVVTSVCVA